MLLFSQHFPRYRGALPVCVNMLDLSLGSSAAMFQMMDCPVADLEGDRGGSRPPPLRVSDRRRYRTPDK